MGFDAEKVIPPGANIKVVGVGGGGGNAVNTMIRSNLEGVEFIAANTDVQALRFALPQKKIQIGKELTKGLGAGADPDIGRDAALEDRHEIQDAISGADMVFITAGMGGGTGTGGASVIAQIARELGALTVAVVTKPFNFEGKRRKRHAEMGIERLRECVDTLITIPNQRLLQIATPELSMVDAFRMADEVLVNAVKGISDIINIPGTVNVDFADVKTVMSSMGMALMGIGRASGQNRAVDAARQAICSPLLEDIDIEGATGILINITASSNLSLMEVNEACSIIQDAAHEDANIIFGAVINESCGDEIRVTVIATGFPAEYEEQVDPNLFQPQRRSAPRQAFTSRYETSSRVVVPQPKQIVTPHNPFTAPTPKPAPVKAFEGATAFAEAKIPETVAADLGYSNEAEDLTRMTMSGNDTLPEEILIEDPSTKHIAQPVVATTQGSIEVPTVEATEFVNHSLMMESDDELVVVAKESAPFQAEQVRQPEFIEFEDADDVLLEQSLLDSEPAPMESMFQRADFESAMQPVDQKLDEAMKLADRLKGATASQQKSELKDDDLDIPAFLRTGIHDLSLD